jgi:hypothetical protein
VLLFRARRTYAADVATAAASAAAGQAPEPEPAT